MTLTVKSKTELVVPRSVRLKAGFKAGDQVEFRASGGVITILPKLPAAVDEYTPEQRVQLTSAWIEPMKTSKRDGFTDPFQPTRNSSHRCIRKPGR
jgi:bifunctional DNA-binding transcriptional regulator/antitoxin component of YhaV-PrlF toxin-antitoxin module